MTIFPKKIQQAVAKGEFIPSNQKKLTFLLKKQCLPNQKQ